MCELLRRNRNYRDEGKNRVMQPRRFIPTAGASALFLTALGACISWEIIFIDLVTRAHRIKLRLALLVTVAAS
jgi:hypothetical protein